MTSWILPTVGLSKYKLPNVRDLHAVVFFYTCGVELQLRPIFATWRVIYRTTYLLKLHAPASLASSGVHRQ